MSDCEAVVVIFVSLAFLVFLFAIYGDIGE